MGVTSSKGCTGPWDPSDTATVHYDFTGCPDDAQVYNEVVWGDSEDITFGLYNEVCAGAYLDITAGMLLEMVIGPMLEVCVGGSFEMAGLPAAAWGMVAPALPSALVKATAQYDIVFGTYYETLYDGAMYYWQPVDSEAFTIHGDWDESGTTLDRIQVHGDHAEVVGSQTIAAGGAGGIKYVAGGADNAVTVAGQSVSVQATRAVTLGANFGNVGLSGGSLLLQGTASCAVKSNNAQVMLSPAGFAVSSGAALSLNAPVQEWGQPVVPPPPEPVAPVDDEADDDSEGYETADEFDDDASFGVMAEEFDDDL
ncbi:MAG: hypothetical protein EBZ74_12190 [Planctomycetia bacterium]|nr:hypothetical protein [Planctomycetia bacterium]